MSEEALIIGFYGGTVLLVSICGVLLSFLFSPKSKNRSKDQPFECGMEVITPPKSKINTRFYFYGMMFLVFDIELIFLMPWALGIAHIGMAGFITGLFFSLLIAAAFIFEWKKGVFSCR